MYLKLELIIIIMIIFFLNYYTSNFLLMKEFHILSPHFNLNYFTIFFLFARLLNSTHNYFWVWSLSLN